MAMLPNRLLWTVIARVAATLCWNLLVPHIAAARAQEPHHLPFSSGDTVSLGFIPDGVVSLPGPPLLYTPTGWSRFYSRPAMRRAEYSGMLRER